MTAVNQIKECIKENKNFVLQGGAGSGKTESLKQLLEFISLEYPDKKIACITHTNLAVDEIKSRVGEKNTISTIHSFLNGFISDYKKNIHQIIPFLFQVEKIIRSGLSVYTNETEQKKEEHEKYKSAYAKYSSRLYSLKKESMPKVLGKREYDKDPERYNSELNGKIDSLNAEIAELISRSDYSKIDYNETRFNDLKELSYGHDGLLEVAHALFKGYPLVGKILQDKYDFIFIDEYQDTNPKIVDIFLNLLPVKDKTVIGLFGDSMQAIYDDGIGNVEKEVADGLLKRVDKEDNYRCSQDVIDHINKLRTDGLEQEIAYKINDDGVTENSANRQGSVTLYYSLCSSKPHARSTQEEKDAYLAQLSALISKALDGDKTYRQLKLSNKSIASDVGFEHLYNIFSDRYLEPQEYLEKDLARLQLSDLYDIYTNYNDSNYNLVLSALRKRGFSVKNIADKTGLKDKFETFSDTNLSAYNAIQKAFELKLVKKSEKFDSYLDYKNTFLSELSADEEYQKMKAAYLAGGNTAIRMRELGISVEDEDFSEFNKAVQKENFFISLFSDDLKLSEILNYYDYLNEKKGYITMHKTKGSGIDNVLVVLEEYFWHAYNFKDVFSEQSDNPERKERTTKLVYVAASRAKHNLKVVKLIAPEEEKDLVSFFNKAIKI